MKFPLPLLVIELFRSAFGRITFELERPDLPFGEWTRAELIDMLLSWRESS